MQAITYYLLLPFIYLISISPFWLMYGMSNCVYVLVYYIIGYRKKVVFQNLRNAFPEKSEEEILRVGKQFYKYLCDVMFETLKMLTWSKKTARKHIRMVNTEIVDEIYDQGRSIIIFTGHLGNWEWSGVGFTLSNKHQFMAVYQPLSNRYFDKLFYRLRTRFGAKIIAKKDTLRALIAHKNELTAMGLIADQAPNPINTAVWMNFLNQDTAVFNGPEKVAKMLDQVVVYMDVQRIKRGYYEVVPTIMFDQPKEAEDNEITIACNKKLEECIRKRPETWLWSHKRWKHKRSTS